MTSNGDRSDSITKIDLKIRSRIARITNYGEAAARENAMEELEQLKERRSEMMSTKTYDRMLSSLK